MSKRLFTLLLSALLTFVLVLPASAAENKTEGQPEGNAAELQKQFNDIAAKYGFEPVEQSKISTSQTSNAPLQFKNAEEFEAFLKSFVEAEKASAGGVSVIEKEKDAKAPAFDLAATFNGHAEWYSFLVNGTFSWKNIDYTYTTGYDARGKGYLTGISNVNSYLTGLQVAMSWTQTSNSSFVTGTTAKLRVGGYYLFGVEIGGFPIGYRHYTTWDRDVVHNNLPDLG